MNCSDAYSPTPIKKLVVILIRVRGLPHCTPGLSLPFHPVVEATTWDPDWEIPYPVPQQMTNQHRPKVMAGSHKIVSCQLRVCPDIWQDESLWLMWDVSRTTVTAGTVAHRLYGANEQLVVSPY